MLTECNVRDCCRLAATVEARHSDSASGGFSQSYRRNIQENVPPNPRAPLSSGSIDGNLHPRMLFVTRYIAFMLRADDFLTVKRGLAVTSCFL